jgi:pimeloyl-ACP methyl ester carboxylesterase
MALLHVRDHGGDGPPLVLLHGHGRSHADWDAAGSLLSSAHRVLAVDLPGHGRSPDVSPWTVPTVLRCLADTMDAHAIEDAIIVGHSLGGLLAVEFARAYPDRTRAAVNLDGFWWGRPGEYPGSERVSERMRAAAGAVAPPEYIEQQVNHAALYGIPAERAEPATHAAVRQLPDGRWQTLPERTTALEVLDELDRLGQLGVTAWLDDAQRPLLLVQATRPHPSRPGTEWFDELQARFARGLEADLTELARTRPAITFARIDASHPMNLEVPDAVAKLVTAYIRDLPNS